MKNKQSEQIFMEYHEKLLGFILKRVSNKADAEDILQDVFLKIHSRIDTLKENSKFQSWIYTITRNAIIDYYRVQQSTKDLPESLSNTDLKEHEIARQELTDCFLPLISTLPPSYQHSFKLSEIDGMNQNKVAEKEGISLPAVKSRILRGRQKLKETLLQCCHFEFDHQGKVLEYQNKRPDCKGCC